MNDDGTLMDMEIDGQYLHGKALLDTMEHRIHVAETDDDYAIREQINDLTMLLAAYQSGFMKEWRK